MVMPVRQDSVDGGEPARRERPERCVSANAGRTGLRPTGPSPPC
jgi:hypothetical protein